MKKTLCLLFGLSAGLACAEVTLNGTTFNTTVDGGSELSSSSALYEITTTAAWTGASVLTYTGLYIDNGSGIKFNHRTNVNVTYLYIGDEIQFGGGTARADGYIRFSDNSNHGFVMTGTAGAWLDINANYGARVAMQNMSGGSVYLNEYGALSSGYMAINASTQGYEAGELSSANTVYATAVFDTSAMPDSIYTYDASSNEVTRTLLSGDYSSWESLSEDALAERVVLSGVTDYTVTASSTGLSVTYSLASKAIPEPATATLSLLALAGLAARRRR